MGTNVVVLVGRLTRDPERKKTQSGIPFVNFALAVDRKYKNAQGDTETDFINCTAWRQLATLICDFCSKGKQLSVTGSLRQQLWTDNEGNKKNQLCVQCEDVEFLANARGNGGGEKPAETVDDVKEVLDYSDGSEYGYNGYSDSLPF